MRRVWAVLLLVAVLLSGCYHEERWGPDDHRLSGTLSEDFNDEDRANLERRAAQRGATDVVFMESFPMQFDIRPLSDSECDNLRVELDQVDYVTTVGTCQRLV